MWCAQVHVAGRGKAQAASASRERVLHAAADRPQSCWSRMRAPRRGPRGCSRRLRPESWGGARKATTQSPAISQEESVLAWPPVGSWFWVLATFPGVSLSRGLGQTCSSAGLQGGTAGRRGSRGLVSRSAPLAGEAPAMAATVYLASRRARVGGRRGSEPLQGEGELGAAGSVGWSPGSLPAPWVAVSPTCTWARCGQSHWAASQQPGSPTVLMRFPASASFGR